jgi:enoyl-CoA hydratase/carnithine racemase
VDIGHHQGVSAGAQVALAGLETRRAAALVTLHREQFEPLVTALGTALPRWAQSPDIYALALTGDFSGDLPDPPTAEHFRLIWAMELSPKPSVALIDGVHGPAGQVFSLTATHRVAAENYSLRFDDLQRGRWHALGMAWVLSRLKPGLGQALLLSGRALNAAEALATGLVTHALPSQSFAHIQERLSEAEPIDPLLDNATSFVKEPWAALESVRQLAASAGNAPDDLRTRATLELMRRSTHLDLRSALTLEWHMRERFAAGERAIDKLFAPITQDALALPPRPPNVLGPQ